MKIKFGAYQFLMGGFALACTLLSSYAAVADALPKNSAATDQSNAAHQVQMYKSPNCACCTGWAKHLEKNGYQVSTHQRDDMDAVKAQHGVSSKISSCHTALVGGYVIEGHVPAEDVKRLLKERPDIVGLAAPGMPMHSPGMQTVGETPHGYDVLAFTRDGKTSVFHHYP